MSGCWLSGVCKLVFIAEVVVAARGVWVGSGWLVSWLDILLGVGVFILMCNLFNLVRVQPSCHSVKFLGDPWECSDCVKIPIYILGKLYHVGFA